MNFAQDTRSAREMIGDPRSYFWSCLTLSDDCILKSTDDPKLFYFGIGVISLYLAFIIIVIADLYFFWSLDSFQREIDEYINTVRNKVRRVQMDQRRLMSTQERTENQLKRTNEFKQVVTALRGAVASADPNRLKKLTSCSLEAEQETELKGTWHDDVTLEAPANRDDILEWI